MIKATCCLSFAVACAGLFAAVEPSALFSDHAVLLRSADTPVFGFADPGETVTVSLGAVSAKGAADAKGRWLVRLDLRSVGDGPFTLKMNDKVAADVLVGEVWLCSGQSNMSFRLGDGDDADAENAVTNLSIRCFKVGGGAVLEPNPRIEGRWLVNRPGETLAMTSVGYHFAKYMQAELKGPFGIVESAVGASTIETWCDPVTMADHPEGKRELDRQIAFMNGYRDYENACDAELRAWETKFGRSDRPHAGPPEAGWRPLNEREKVSFSQGPGAIWLKRTLRPAKAGAGIRFERRRFIERQWCFDNSTAEVYWNGRRLARTYPDDPIEKNTELYDIPASETGPEGGTLLVRLFNAESIPGAVDYFFADRRKLDLAGWTLAREFALPYATAEMRAVKPERQRFCLRQHYPVGLFNGKIAGLVPMGLSGVIWYQGESNARRADKYEALFVAMIKSWRKLFEKPELPFVWCQLAGYTAKAKDPNGLNEDWPRLRAAQTRTLALPMTGQAVLIDAGEERDIHPRDKRTPGRRLAAWALNRVYGRKDLPFRGPHAVSCRAEGNKAVVTFADCGKGLVAKDLGTKYIVLSRNGLMGDVKRNSPGAQVEGFAVAGADGKWAWADEATIDGETVAVSAKAVPAPKAVRYGWAQDPWVNLYNAEGFPAEPFELKAAAAGHEVASSTLRLELNDRGEIARLVTRGGVAFSGARPTPLFRLDFTRADDFTAMKSVASSAAGKVETKPVPDGVDVVFSGFAADLPLERAVCRVRGERDGKRVRFGLSTVTRDGWALTGADYPRLVLTRKIGASAEDDAFLSGDVFGGGSNPGKAVIRYPADPAREKWEVHFGFPGSLTVQFAEFYDPAAGLVFAAEDAEGGPKTFHAVRKDDGFLASWTARMWEPGAAESPYDVTLAAFEGTPADPATWHDGADIYREWASRQRWCAKPIAARTDLPDWMRDAPALTMFTREAWFDRPDDIRGWVHDYFEKRHAGVPTVAALWGWEHHGTWLGFDYFPCHPSDDVMRSLMADMRGAGLHPYPWPSGYFWTVQYDRRADGTFAFDDTASFARTGAAHAVVGRDGKLVEFRNYWLKGGLARELCGGDPWTIPWVTETVGKGLAERGCELIQGDQLNGGAFGDCWSRTHGHPPGAGVWKARAARRQLEEMRKAIAAVHPGGGVVTYEEANETLNDLCGIQLVRKPRDPKAPVEKANPYTYLHHEYLPMFGSYPPRSDYDWAAYSATEGLMPRFIPSASDIGGFALPPTFYAAVTEVSSSGTNRFHYGENADATDRAFRPGRRFRLSADLEAVEWNRGARLSLDFGVYTRELKPLYSDHVDFPKPGEGRRRVSRAFTMPEGPANILRIMVNCAGNARGKLGGFRLESVEADGSVRDVRYEGNARYETFISRWIDLYRGEGRAFLAYGRHVKPPFVKCERQRADDSAPGNPAVYAGAFEAVDGTCRRAAVFANATDRRQAVDWTVRGVTRRLELEPSGIVLVTMR